MPEIGEVARVVHYIRKNLVNKTLTSVTANVDEIVYGKVGTSAAEFEKNMLNKKVVSAGQQGKYFWMIMSSPPHPVMHLGMSGWFKFDKEHTFYYRKKDNEDDSWPPKYAKFVLEAKGDKSETPVGAAFVDARRLGRIRLVNCDGKDIRNNTPLKENGPDPVIDSDIVTLDWLTEKCNKKKVPIKAMLLDQAVISGIGNWVGDEIMYHAKMHPEQYANTLQKGQIAQLHKSLHYVCKTTCDLLADSEQFPDDWLFKHRWSKGKKKDTATPTLPNGNKIVFLTVGGRTSAVVPAVQKKTGHVAGDVEESAKEDGEEAEELEEEEPVSKPKTKTKKRKATPEDEESSSADETVKRPTKKSAVSSSTSRTTKANGVKPEPEPKPEPEKKATKSAKIQKNTAPAAPAKSTKGKKAESTPSTTEAKATKSAGKNKKPAKAEKAEEKEEVEDVKVEESGRRRSGRLRK